MGGFARDAPKAENGFILLRIVSSASSRRNNSRKMPIISERTPDGSKPPGRLDRRTTAPAREAPSCARLARFTCVLRFSAEEKPNEGWILSNRERFGRDPSHRNRDAWDHRAHSREEWPS